MTKISLNLARQSAADDEIKRLKAELRRVTEERDILKKATAPHRQVIA